MDVDDFLESISESEYVYFHSETGLFFSWNGLSVVNIWSTDSDFDVLDTIVIRDARTVDDVQEKIDHYIETVS